MLHVQCNTCFTSAYVDCTCPDGWEPMVHGHVTAAIADVAQRAGGVSVSPCPYADIDALITCSPGQGCCEEDHHHGDAANSCPGGHGACPTPNRCRVWAGVTANLRHPLVNEDPGPCPGGHCGLTVEGCTVCRPLTITVIPGSTQVQPVSALRAALGG